MEIQPGRVLVLVGPNNSGKSYSLREIEEWCIGSNNQRRIIDEIEIDFPTDPAQGLEMLRRFEAKPPEGQGTSEGHFWLGVTLFRRDQSHRHEQVSIQNLQTQIQNQNAQVMRNLILSTYTMRLDGRTRFTLVDPKPSGDLHMPPQNHLWALFVNDAARERVRQWTSEALKLHFVIDPTAMQRFRIRMSPRAPANKQEEQALDEAARAFHSSAQPVEQLGDGVQAFSGILSAVLSLPHKVMLIDEPEAFLHPPLANRLGSYLAALALEREGSLIIATHSADFLLGCVGGTVDTDVVRLTYEGGQATARSLNAANLAGLMRDPLLRSANVLRALFHRAAVVAEADSDRAFYEEMNRRLLAAGRGIPDCLFVNAQNKGTVRRLVGPLRIIGMPAAAVVDLDIMKVEGEWSALLDACQVPAARRIPLETARAKLVAAFATLPPVGGKEAMKVSGIAGLPGPLQTVGSQTFDELEDYGVFIVRGGEAESWLRHLGATKHGSEWLVEIFGLIGQSDDDPNYLAPGPDDVWAFIDRIAAWVANPARKGTAP